MSKILRSKKLVKLNRAVISRMRMEGYTRHEILDKVNKDNEGLADPISIHAIDQDLMAARKQWAASIPWTQMEMRSQMKAEIERVKRNAWKAYELSCLKSNRQTAMLDPQSKEPVGAVSLTQEVRYGDPRMLQVVMECIEMEARLFGLHPKEAIEIYGAGAKKQINVAFIVDTKGKTMAEVANFPVKGEIRPKELTKPPEDEDFDFEGNGSGNGA
jgi:hypothetical protein